LEHFSPSSGTGKEVMGTFFKGLDKDVIRVFPGGYANWKELEKESSVRFGHDCF